MNERNTEQGLPLLLEIGTEEIPARFLRSAISDMRGIASNIFGDYRIPCGGIRVYATPRRLVLHVDNVSPKQNDVVKEVFGPSKKAAFDEAGNPTKAAAGFANSLGITTAALTIKTKGKGEYVAAVIEEKGAETRAILPEALRKIILSLRFPKSMRWGDRNLLFVRPIHWIVSILGTETIPIEIDGIKGGNITRGHRFLAPASFQIREISSFMNNLEKNFVVLDHEKREKMIRSGIAALAAETGGLPVMDEDLLNTVNFLVEYPVPVLCGFDAEYLKLPKELLIVVMKDHQKYFAIHDAKGDLSNSFIVISNTRAENRDTVRTGAERVIRARFDDARFYYEEDRRKPLSERVEDLKKVTFHDELGSLHGKTERLISIASFLSQRLDPQLSEKVRRAALLSKTDLITGVVREFPELQGTMGKYYALHDGQDRETAAALEEQYLPKSFGDRLPETGTGALLSLSDKIDNIAAFFSIGLIPTGSEDPFALRRQAMGIVSIILERGYNITLNEIFDEALKSLAGLTSRGNVSENIALFMEQRVEFILTSTGFEQELVKSVLSLSQNCPLKYLTGRIEALRKFVAEEIFPEFLLAIKRVNNIIPKTPLPAIREELLQQDEEKELYSSFLKVRDEVLALIDEGRFHDALGILSGITAPINGFFDKVLVMDKQQEIKENRLSLLREIWTIASRCADFSKLA